MKKAVVVGGSGFIGSHVADQLSDAGHKVRIFDCVESPWLRPNQEMACQKPFPHSRVLAYNFPSIHLEIYQRELPVCRLGATNPDPVQA